MTTILPWFAGWGKLHSADYRTRYNVVILSVMNLVLTPHDGLPAIQDPPWSQVWISDDDQFVLSSKCQLVRQGRSGYSDVFKCIHRDIVFTSLRQSIASGVLDTGHVFIGDLIRNELYLIEGLSNFGCDSSVQEPSEAFLSCSTKKMVKTTESPVTYIEVSPSHRSVLLVCDDIVYIWNKTGKRLMPKGHWVLDGSWQDYGRIGRSKVLSFEAKWTTDAWLLLGTEPCSEGCQIFQRSHPGLEISHVLGGRKNAEIVSTVVSWSMTSNLCLVAVNYFNSRQNRVVIVAPSANKLHVFNSTLKDREVVDAAFSDAFVFLLCQGLKIFVLTATGERVMVSSSGCLPLDKGCAFAATSSPSKVAVVDGESVAAFELPEICQSVQGMIKILLSRATLLTASSDYYHQRNGTN